MKHLCLDVRMVHVGGIGTFLKTLLPFLAKEFALTLLHTPKDKHFLMAYTSSLIPMKSPLFSLREQIELPQKIPPCDLFWAPHFNIPLLPIRSKKKLVTIHDTYYLTFLSTLPLIKKIYAKIFYNIAMRADIVTTDSQFSFNEILKYCFCQPKKLIPIHLGIRPYFFSPPHPQTTLSHYNLPKDFLLFIGTKSHKNFSRLVKAYATLKAPPLVAIGKNLSRFASSAKQIYCIEQVQDEELPLFYRAAKAFIYPSLYEGFGLPPLEAMACGCPVVAAKAGSIPEVCQDAVEYIDPQSVDSIKKGIENLLHSTARSQELIAKGKRLVKKYSPEKCAQKYLEVIHENCHCS